MFLAASRDYEYPVSHRGTTFHYSHTPIESRKSNHDLILIPTHQSHDSVVTGLNGPQHATYITSKRDTNAEYLA